MPVPQPKTGTVVSVLPASGNRNGSNLNNHGSNGNYWSSTVSDVSYAYNLHFYNSDHIANGYFNRFFGFPVRPVAKP
jgi:hypothetical protein